MHWKSLKLFPFSRLETPTYFSSWRPTSLYSFVIKHAILCIHQCACFLWKLLSLHGHQNFHWFWWQAHYLAPIFIDLSKTFSTTDHNMRYGIQGVTHDWFESYLENRQQYVWWLCFRTSFNSYFACLNTRALALYSLQDIHKFTRRSNFIIFAWHCFLSKQKSNWCSRWCYQGTSLA